MTKDAPQYGRIVEDVAEWIITLSMLGLMVAAFVVALGWPERAAFFPLLLSGFGSALLILKVVQMVSGAILVRTGTLAPSPKASVNGGDDEAEETGRDSIFYRSGGKEWLETLLCLAAFFLLLSLAGVVATIILFGIGYLKFIAGKSLLFSVIYSGLLVCVVYVMFVVLLGLPLPEGVFFQ